MEKEEILRTLENVGAVITKSHFVYTSGRHGEDYINKDALYPHTRIVARLCRKIADYFWGNDIKVVAGPTVGGVALAQWVAHYYNPLEHQPQILAVYAEEEGEKRVFRRGYAKLISGKRVLVVDDVLTTGGSVKKVVEAVRELGGEVVGVGVLANRGKVTIQDVGDVPEIFTLIDVDMKSFPEEKCPLCKKGIPINTEFGKGREYLARKSK